jgi:hypothetical protein
MFIMVMKCKEYNQSDTGLKAGHDSCCNNLLNESVN